MLWSAASFSFCPLLKGRGSYANSGKNTDLRPRISSVVFSAPALGFCWFCSGVGFATGASGRLFNLSCCASAHWVHASRNATISKTPRFTPGIRRITLVHPLFPHRLERKKCCYTVLSYVRGF